MLSPRQNEGARLSPQFQAEEKTAEQCAVAENLLALFDGLWQSLEALRALLKLRLGRLPGRPFCFQGASFTS
jgi:hypothetical protein